jgi:hypothetical protein
LFRGETVAPLLIRRGTDRIIQFPEESGFNRVEVWHEGSPVLAFPAAGASIERTTIDGARAVRLKATIGSLIGGADVAWESVIFREAQSRTMIGQLAVAGHVLLAIKDARPLTELADLVRSTDRFDAGTPRLPWVVPAGNKAKVQVRTYPHDTDEKAGETAFRWPVLTIERRVSRLPLRMHLAQDPLLVQRPSLRWLERVVSAEPESDDPLGDWVVESELPGSSGAETWNVEVVDACMRGLHIVRDASPLTLLPTLGSDTGLWRFAAVISIREGKPVTEVTTLQPITFASDASPVEITFGGFRTHGGTGLRARALVINRRDSLNRNARELGLKNKRGSTFESRGASGIWFALQFHALDASTAVTRVGALDLAFCTADLTTLDPRWPSAFFHAQLESRERFPDQVPVFNIDCDLPLSGIDPGGQDPVAGEDALPFVPHQPPGEPKPKSATVSREAPIVIPLERSDASPVPVMRLIVEEDTQANFNQTIRMRIDKLKSVLNDRSVVVIDRQPFLVARVDVPRFGAIDIEGTTPELGNWSNVSPQGPIWELHGGADAFTLVLPPQGVGEAMEKGEGYVDIEKDQHADFRFTPPLRAELAPTFFRQRFAEASWNLRRILGTPGDRAPGAGLLALDFELLYGLSCSVRTPFLRFAEIAARLGHLPAALDPRPDDTVREKDRRAFEDFVHGWDEKRRLLQSRLSVVEPWSERQPDELQITDDLSYRFRSTAKLRHPLDRTKTDPERDGLAGGVTWPLESKNFYNLLLTSPQSDPKGNRLVAPAFSALGGWGQQRASFLNGRVTVISNTAMGRTSYLSIEIIGRIGVYWNRAKYVVIYERSVLPSRQFHLEQERHEGRAVVRKVREYVEVLQPLRTFPEANSGAVAASRGFVLGCEFKSKIMAVNSRWGGDFGSEGFRLPLWRRGAEPSDVYPQPHVVLRVATDPQSGRELDEVEIDDPENLVFYANAAADANSNTDDWSAVPWIDYAPVALPKPRTNDVTDIPPADPDVVPGLGGFTRRVVPSGRAANVVADRATDAINAVIRNVTMMRADPERLATVAESPLAKLEQLRDLPAAIGDMLARELRLEQAPIQSAKNLLARLQATGGELQRLGSLLTSGISEKACNDVAGALDAELAAQQAKAVARLLDVRNELLVEVEQLLGQGQSWTASLKQQALMTLEDAFALLELQLEPFFRFFERASEQLDALRNVFVKTVDAAINRIRSAPTVARTAVAELRQHIHRELTRHADRAEELLRRALAGQTPKLTGVVRRIEEELDEKLADVLAAIDAGQTVDQTVTALQELKAQVQAISIDAEIAALKTALQEVAFDLRAKLEAMRTTLAGAIRAASGATQPLFERIRNEINAALPDEKTINDALTAARADVVKQAKTACETVRQPIADAVQRVQERIAALEEAFQGSDAEKLRRAVESFASRTAQQADALVRSVSKNVDLSDPAKAADNVLRLVRAVGDPPRVPNLSFPSGREAIAYLFDEKKRAVDITPVVAYVNRVSEALQPLGLDLPTRSLLDRVIPADLTKFDVSKIFRDFAGMKLAGLFPNLKLPDKANQAVRVEHGFDQQSLRAWLEAHVDVPMDQPATIFAFGPVVLRLLSARFTAHVRVEATPGEPARQRARGEISGNWELQIGGTVIATFRNTRLTFDDRGNINFSISPQNVELNGALKFLTDLIASTGSFNDSGFSIEVTPVPPRIRSVLNLPLPDIQLGAFGISNLRLGCGFGLELEDFRRFVITVDLNVGRKTAPFALTVFILGGGGWLDTHTRYPIGGTIDTTVSIGITAGASLAIALGPIRGGVYIYFGITVEYRSSGGPVLIGIMILIAGVVSLLGIVDISISLLLEAQYGGGRLIGRGTLSAKIKICWCFTLEVSETVQYEFGSAAQSETEALADQYDAAAERYVAALA